MSVLLLFLALQRLQLTALTRLVAAVSVFAVEMQIATWSSVATIRTLVFVNLAIAAIALTLRRRHTATPRVHHFDGFSIDAYWSTAAVVGLLVLALNLSLPLTAADPYHLERVAQIERLGTLQYDLAAAEKVNVVGWTYEVVLADLDQIPLIGHALVRLHGVFGVAIYLLAIASTRTWLSGGRAWCRAVLLVLPVVFHQFVLVKNDLFGAVPAVVVLAWLATRAPDADAREIGWAAWLAGFAVGVKLTSAPLLIVMAGALIIYHRGREPGGLKPVILALGAGVMAGLACAGLVFTLIENARWYGHPLEPFDQAGGSANRNASIAQAAVSVGRFVISLFDLGLVTRKVWPGRGGWGATFGLPLVGALAMLALRYRESIVARRALLIAGAYFLMFAAAYTDADLAHRLALAPGVLLVLVAVHLSDGEDRVSRSMRHALVAVLIVSAAQIARSAMLYLRLPGAP